MTSEPFYENTILHERNTAFEVLVNLFLCKLVDEEENRDNLKFYWNGPASDNYFRFC